MDIESYAALQSVPLGSSLCSSHSPQTMLLSTLLRCSDFLLTRSRLGEFEASETAISRAELAILFKWLLHTADFSHVTFHRAGPSRLRVA